MPKYFMQPERPRPPIAKGLWWFLPWAVVAVVASGTALASETDRISGEIVRDPAKILGPDTCTKCHEHEMQQWHRTPHFATFDTLHRKPEAKAIADRLDLRSVKRNDTCVGCHYTEQLVGSRVRVVSGISCESCHGAARDWIAIHNDYGGPNATKESESPEHRHQRIAASVEAGMNNPVNLYLIARQCLSCHTTPNEQLVNEGHHTAGSKDFELVAWSQGMVRHNFLRTGGSASAGASPAELRVMFVVGIMADLEASLRATAQATVKGPFGIASAQRAAALKRKLYDLSLMIQDPNVDDALRAALAVPLKLNHRVELVEAADVVSQAARDFAATADGNTLSPIDALLPAPSEYKN